MGTPVDLLDEPPLTPTAILKKDKKDKKTAELEQAVLVHPSKRTNQQSGRVSAFLATVRGVDSLSLIQLNNLVHAAVGQLCYNSQVIYRAGDSADGYYIIVRGGITLVDPRDKENDKDEVDDPQVAKLVSKQGFGEEELLSQSRRAYTAQATEEGTVLIKITPHDYRHILEDVHTPAFEDKVDFLSSLSPFKPLRNDVVRKLAPCFQLVEYKMKELMVRQGDRADAMYAIKTGKCVVLVDPHYKMDDPNQKGLADIDPKKTMQVCVLDPGTIIGDITVLANVRKRTATVITQTEVVAYKIRRSTFIRRLPTDQLETLRRLAAEKLRMTDKKVQTRANTKGLQDKILHGHNLRELYNVRNKGNDNGQDTPEEYQQLIHLLRRYKRSEVSRFEAVPKLLVKHDPSEWGRSTAPPGTAGFMSSGPRAQTVGTPGPRSRSPPAAVGARSLSAVNLPSAPTSPSIVPSQGFVFPKDDPLHPSHGQLPPGWYPTTPHHSRQATRPFSATLRSLPVTPAPAATGRGQAAGGRQGHHLNQQFSRRMEREPFVLEIPPPTTERRPEQPISSYGFVGDTYDLPGSTATSPTGAGPTAAAGADDGMGMGTAIGSSFSSRFGPPMTLRSPSPGIAMEQPPRSPQYGGGPGSPYSYGAGRGELLSPAAANAGLAQSTARPITPGWSSQQLQLPSAGYGAMQRLQLHSMTEVPADQQKLEAVLDTLARPLMKNKASKLRKGGAHFRPTIPRAVL